MSRYGERVQLVHPYGEENVKEYTKVDIDDEEVNMILKLFEQRTGRTPEEFGLKVEDCSNGNIILKRVESGDCPCGYNIVHDHQNAVIFKRGEGALSTYKLRCWAESHPIDGVNEFGSIEIVLTQKLRKHFALDEIHARGETEGLIKRMILEKQITELETSVLDDIRNYEDPEIEEKDVSFEQMGKIDHILGNLEKNGFFGTENPPVGRYEAIVGASRLFRENREMKPPTEKHTEEPISCSSSSIPRL